jgi:hypothetical protein
MHADEAEHDVEEFEVLWMITECLGRYETVGNGGDAKFVDTSDGVDGRHEFNEGCSEQIEEDMGELLAESKTPLYEGCSTNCLVATLFFYNCFIVFDMSNACANKILKLMKELLPSKNSLPKSHYKAQKYLGHMGLSYTSIHTCRFDYCLYRKDLKDAKTVLYMG